MSDTYPKGAAQGTWKALSDTLRQAQGTAYPARQGTWKALSGTYAKRATQGTWKALSDTYAKRATQGTWKALSDTCPAKSGTYPVQQDTWKALSDTLRQAQGGAYPKGAEQGTTQQGTHLLCYGHACPLERIPFGQKTFC